MWKIVKINILYGTSKPLYGSVKSIVTNVSKYLNILGTKKDNTIENIILDKNRVSQMGKNALKVSTNNVEDKIYKEILKTINNKKN